MRLNLTIEISWSFFEADHLVDADIEAVHYFEEIAHVHLFSVEHAGEGAAGNTAFISEIVKGYTDLLPAFLQCLSDAGKDLVDIRFRQLFYGRLFVALCHSTNLPN